MGPEGGMNGRAGLTSFLVVIATTFGLLVPVERGRVAAVRPAGSPSPAQDNAVAARGSQVPVAGLRPVLGSDLVCQYVHGGRDEAAQPTGHCDRDTAQARVVIAHVLIAILPDPLDSHLDWAFDGALESIQRAFERAGFVPDRYSLPWRPVPDSSRGESPAAAELRASAPGVMLFRASSSGRDTLALVYFVGETPTRGIQARAFRVAVRDIDTLATRVSSGWKLADGVRDTLRIVGPIFSGSARSLRNALADAYRATAGEVVVISGGATAPSNRLMLRGCPGLTIAALAPCPGGHLRFFATVQPVDTLRAVIERALCEDFDIDPGRIAYLKESNTQYTAGLLADTARANANARCTADTSTSGPAAARRPLEIPFPINISRFRREYARTVGVSDSSGRGATTPRTHMDWRDPASAAESPPPLSELTAPIIEQTLTDIEQTLVLHRVRAVGIVATDVRDRLFLASLVKERFRDVKIFFVGSHALYLRPELNEYLRGALVVSTYPLFLENQFWDLSHAGDRERLVFTSDQSEGTYNAALIQLGHEQDATDYNYPLMQRGPSDSASCGPPVWLTVVGAGSMMPLVAKETNRVAAAPEDDAYVYRRACPTPPPNASTEDPDAVGDTGPFVWTLVILFGAMIGAAARKGWRRIGAVGAKMLAWFRRRAAPVEAQLATTRTRPASTRRVERRLAVGEEIWAARSYALLMHRQSWLAFGFVAVGCGAATLALILFRPQVHGVVPLTPKVWLLGPFSTARLGLVCIIGIFVAAGVLLGRVVLTDFMQWHAYNSREADHLPWLQHVGLLLVAMLYLVFTGAWIWQIAFFRPAQGAMYLLRTLQLNSGVTPALPALLGAVILGVWSYAHLRRVKELAVTSAFESACLTRTIDASFVPPEQHYTPPRGVEAIQDGDNAVRRAGALRLGTAFNLRRWVGAVRSSLLDLFPRLGIDAVGETPTDRPPRRLDAIAFAGILVLFWCWLLFTQIDRTNEVAALGPWLAPRFTPSSFDLLFRFLIVSSVTLSAWTLYRLFTTWGSLRNCLRNIEVMPLGRGFERLPKSIATVARFSPFAPPHASLLRYELDRAAYQRWHWLRRAARPPAEWIGDVPVLRTNPRCSAADIAAPFDGHYTALCQRVLEEPALLSVSEDPPQRQVADDSVRAVTMTLQELVALYVIDYVAWALRHVRELAIYLLGSLTLTTALLSSYPFEPASLLKVTFFTLMAVSVIEVGTVLIQVNRNATLSRIAHTTPGEVTWDLRFIVNLALVAGVPLLTVLAAQFPEVRDFLFAWVTPIVKALGKV
jgi:hypothetical protein